MSRYVTDTHALYWHLTENSKLSGKARDIFRKADDGVYRIYIPSIVLVEMVYLAEKDRINRESLDKVFELVATVGGSYSEAPLDTDTVKALMEVPRSDIPDMPDRIIAATAHQLGIPLISRDGKIQSAKITDVIW